MPKRSGERHHEEVQIKNVLNPNDIVTGIEKLNRRIVQVNSLLHERVRWNAQKRKDVEFSIHETILDIFGEQSPQNKRYGHYRIWKGSLNIGDPESVMQRKFEEGIPEAVTMLESLIENLEEKQQDIQSQLSQGLNNESSVSSISVQNKNAVFVIHGRNENLRKSLFELLRCIGLHPIEWSEAIKMTGKASPFKRKDMVFM